MKSEERHEFYLIMRALSARYDYRITGLNLRDRYRLFTQYPLPEIRRAVEHILEIDMFKRMPTVMEIQAEIEKTTAH